MTGSPWVAHKLGSWVRSQRARGVSLPQLLLWRLPRMLAGKGTQAIVRVINERVVAAGRDEAHRVMVREALSRCGDHPYFLTVVPYINHYVIPAVALAARHAHIVLVFNGTRSWEERMLRDRFPDLPAIRLHSLGGSMLPHGLVLDILLRHAERDFGIIDPDLYVFAPEVFDELKLREGEFAAGALSVTNRKNGITFPTTHLLSINVGVVQSLMERHGINALIHRRTPAHLVEPLQSIGVGDDNFLKDYLAYYDPFNLLLAMALVEGHKVRVLRRDEDDVFHVGGVSYLEENTHLDYFNLRFLSLPFASEFADRYRRHLVGSLTLPEARARFVAEGRAEVLERLDRRLDRLAAAVR